ncbi:MAG TPA: divergent PAP2 family protein [Gemmatimonadaceae bacterium]|jgi:acid phosphatase family membrane protein YuiD|nr:divergent PAP2 family protein [Gemmatimonadaceae bacterium]HXS10897.1 divergent PAP2 family protein [Candidatus Krumholzibacteria bacterium]
MIHRVAIAALVAGLTAQMLKVVIELVRTRRLNLLRFFDNGGMPSSHTALVTALTIGVGRDAGVGSPLFAVTLLFSLYFVFEAAGLRMEVGNQARTLNELVDELRHTHHLDRERLKELVGHTWGEVFGGFLYGALVAAVASL